MMGPPHPTPGNPFLASVVGLIVVIGLAARQLVENWLPSVSVGVPDPREPLTSTHWTFSGTVSPLRQSAEVELPRYIAAVEVLRLLRDSCVRCRKRRVLYRIRVGGTGMTEARCSSCWGIR